MKDKELESKLRTLPLMAPSGDLDARVLAQKPERPMRPFRARRRVPVWVTVGVALIMAVVGFAGGVLWRGGKPVARHDQRPPVRVQVIYNSPTSPNPFDFTTASHFFPAGELEVTTRKLETRI